MKQRKTPITRKLSMYGFDLVAGGHIYHALLDFDITNLRSLLRQRRREGAGGSLLSFFLKTIGTCLKDVPELNAMINYRTTTRFDSVDINIPIEVEYRGELIPKQLVIRDINRKTIGEVDAQIHASKHDVEETSGYISSPFVRWVLDKLPKSMVLFLFRRILGNHKRVQKLSGTVFVTSVSMFSNIPGYAVPYAGGPNAVSFALGSTIKKPVVMNNTVEIREIMHISVSFNHDLVDGAPAARFLNRFRFYVEKSPQSVIDD